MGQNNSHIPFTCEFQNLPNTQNPEMTLGNLNHWGLFLMTLKNVVWEGDLCRCRVRLEISLLRLRLSKVS